MTIRKYSSRSQQTTLSTGITSNDATATVVSGANLLSSVNFSIAGTFTVVIDPDTALEEIVDVTGRSGNVLDISRGIENGGTGVAHSAGAVVRHMVTGRDLQESNDHIKNETTAHGLTIANVVQTGTTGTVDSEMILDGTIVNADINASAAIADTKLGTISTAGKVSNSATTAASANTASAIVARDGSGNFTAGTITADLTGTASAATLAAAATALATGRTIALTGDVTGTTGSFDGTGNATMTSAIAAGVIVDADINASAAIDKTKISGTAVTVADTGTVTSAMIEDGTIVNADVSATAAIAKTKLDLGGTITSADIVDGTIVATDIANGTITAAKLVTDPYARANHTGTQTASTISDFDTQVRTNRLDQMAAPTGSVSLNSQKITSLATPTENTDASTKLYVDTKVADLVNSAPSTLDTLGEIATAIEAGGTVYESFVLKAGSTMTGALTLSGAPTVDLHAATKSYVDTVAGSTAAAQAAQAAAEAALDSFDDRYLGSKSTAPTLDNDGDALIEGAIYWNSVDNAMYAWTGSEWGSISSTAAIYRYRFNATGGETSVSGTDANGITLSYLPGKEQVYLNGVLLVRTTDYTASNGTSITSLAALTSGDVLEIITFTAFDLATAIPNTAFDAKGDLLVATAADTVGKLAVGTNGYFLSADSSTGTGLAWAAVSQYSLPSQTGNSGKFLTTDGSTESWATVTTDPTADIFMMMGA